MTVRFTTYSLYPKIDSISTVDDRKDDHLRDTCKGTIVLT